MAPISRRVILNISGEVYETYEATLARYPDTLLGDPFTKDIFYCKRNKQYFIPRKRGCFDAILFFYQSYGRLSCPPGTRINDFVDECHFFGLPEQYVNKMAEEEGLLCFNTVNRQLVEGSLAKRLWGILEYPELSNAARMYAFITYFVIFFAILTACLETMPSLAYPSVHITHNPWRALELGINLIFLLELLLRVCVAPNKRAFSNNLLNLIDCVAVLPYFIVLIAVEERGTNIRSNFLRILRCLRVVRLLRVSRQSRSLQVACTILQTCFNDLQLFLVFFIIMTTLGGSLMYFIEKDVPGTMYTSIPESFYWAVQTICTVGYGDIYPHTVMGKVMCGCFMALAIMLTAIPVLSIVTRFEAAYAKSIHPHRVDE